MDRFVQFLRSCGPNVRVWAIIATVAWGVMAVLWGCERFMDPRDEFADGGAEGPYSVHITGLTNEGAPVFAVDQPVETVAPGEYFGWISHLCLEPGVTLLTRPDIVRLPDEVVVVAGHERMWTPADRRCGPVAGGLLIPTDAKYGLYELRRTIWAHPLSWSRQRVRVASVRFRVAPATKDAP